MACGLWRRGSLEDMPETGIFLGMLATDGADETDFCFAGPNCVVDSAGKVEVGYGFVLTGTQLAPIAGRARTKVVGTCHLAAVGANADGVGGVKTFIEVATMMGS